MGKKVSIMIPVRGRVDKFEKCVGSFASTGSWKHKTEFIVKVDTDESTVPYCDILSKYGYDFKILQYSRPRGYNDLYVFWNDMARLSQGESLWMMNDDVTIREGDWMAVISKTAKSTKGRFIGMCREVKKTEYVEAERGRTGYPIIGRAVYEQMGCLCQSAICCDRMLRDIASATGCTVKLPIIIVHDTTGRQKGGMANDLVPPPPGLHTEQSKWVTSVIDKIGRKQ